MERNAGNQEHPSRVRQVSDATRAEQFSVWAMRLWWRAFPELDAAWPDLVSGFRACGVPQAIESCHRFCSLALATAGRGDGVGCLQCPQINPVEECLLGALALARAADLAAVEARLAEALPVSVARLAAPHAVAFAQILGAAGLQWPEVPAEIGDYSRPGRGDLPVYSLSIH